MLQNSTHRNLCKNSPPELKGSKIIQTINLQHQRKLFLYHPHPQPTRIRITNLQIKSFKKRIKINYVVAYPHKKKIRHIFGRVFQ